MVVADVLAHQPFQMRLVEDDDMVKKVASAVANPTFGNTVLPGTAEARPPGLDAEALHRADDFVVEVRSAIEDQVGGHLIIRKGLAQLVGNPSAIRMSGDVEMKDPPPVMRNHKEAVDTPKASVGTVKKSIAAIASR